MGILFFFCSLMLICCLMVIAFIIKAARQDKAYMDSDEAENLERLKIIYGGSVQDDQCN